MYDFQTETIFFESTGMRLMAYYKIKIYHLEKGLIFFVDTIKILNSMLPSKYSNLTYKNAGNYTKRFLIYNNINT